MLIRTARELRLWHPRLIMAKRTQSAGGGKPTFDTRAAADWLADAERFERMSEQLKENAALSEAFRQLAADARQTALLLGGGVFQKMARK